MEPPAILGSWIDPSKAAGIVGLIWRATRFGATATYQTSRITAQLMRLPLKYATDFAKNVINPSRRTIILNAKGRITTTDITPLYSLALAVRATPLASARFLKSLLLNVGRKFVLREARKIVRDVAAPIYTTNLLYRLYRIDRLAAGKTNLVERVIDKKLFTAGKYLAKVKLQPKTSLLFRSYVRIALVGTVAFNYKQATDFVKTQAAKGRAEIERLNPSTPTPILLPPPARTQTLPSTPVLIPSPAPTTINIPDPLILRKGRSTK